MPDDPNPGGPHGRRIIDATETGLMPDDPNPGGPHGGPVMDPE